VKVEEKKERFKVRETTSGSKTVWIVSGYKLNGQRVRLRFDTEKKAEGERELLEAETVQQETYQPKLTRLTADQLAAAERAFAIIGEGASIVEAATFYRDHYHKAEKRITVRNALPEYEAAKGREGIRERSLEENLSVIRKLPSGRFLDTFLPEEIEEIIRCGVATTFNTQRGRMSSFFSWAVQNGYRTDNPIDRIPAAKVDAGEPEAFTVDQCKRILRAASAVRNGAFLPYSVLALQAGLRPEEIKRIEWADINLEDAEITVGGKAAKTRRRRIVELDNSAVDWLKSCQGSALVPEAFRDVFNEVKTVAGFAPDKSKAKRLRKKYKVDKKTKLEEWIRDGLRHTAISMHLAKHGDENATASWAGNSPRIIHAHYKGLVRKTEAAAFWAITPDNVSSDGGEVVEMGEAAS